MKVLMLGWEFPPNSVGGLGTHTYEIVKALSKKGVKISLLLPYEQHYPVEGVEFEAVPMNFVTGAYSTFSGNSGSRIYGDVASEIRSYAAGALLIAMRKDFDIIHANDWLTGIAGVEIKKKTGKPLVLTIHSTEYDRTADHPWGFIRDAEKFAMDNADLLVAVSERLRQQLISVYKCDPNKITVIHNAIDPSKFSGINGKNRPNVLLYVGRLSIQKGIDHLIRAFKIVSEQDKDVLLYIAGEGPELKGLIELTMDLGLQDRVIFLGRIRDEEIEYLYSLASVFIMPSVSEPFGITALEAVASGTPTIISAQSGVSEVLKNTIKVDFWDSQNMADAILGLLRYPSVKETMSSEAYKELSNMTWENRADRFIEVYKKILAHK